MRIFILHNKMKADSYAESLFLLLIQLLSEQGFAVKEGYDIRQIQEGNSKSEKAAFILHTGKNNLSFFSSLKLRIAIKKQGFQCMVQFTDMKFISLSLPQLIVLNDTKNFVAKNFSSPVSFAVCSNVAMKNIAENNEAMTDHIKMIPLAAEDIFQSITWSEQQSVKMQHTQGREYFLVFSESKTIQSFTELLKAFSTFKKWQHSSMKLVVVGKLSFTETDEWNEKIGTYKFREDVVMLDSLGSREFIQILSGAYVFIHTPSIDNDILPLLQSMKCETPCISFATDSIEEYAAEAVAVIEQNNYDQLAEKMILLYKDEALRSRLIAKGKEVSQLYTKEKTFASLTDALSSLFH